MIEDLKVARKIANQYANFLYSVFNGTNDTYADLDEYTNTLAETCFIVDANGKTVGLYGLMAGGGPTVWFNTYDQMVYASTSGETAGWGIGSDICQEINELFVW